ncbi:hypothetical protein GSI01S_06_02110 [Gordonia sihwensis NBRC 108236]|uniref:Uncharacterized protein n=2 Tax=Gordonia TaxID=2053 RepID=L7LIZ0_9ACTN|nr:hypothetical protein GSI01S_06_02110 [Gordonia sihwensis NBRC 108236]
MIDDAFPPGRDSVRARCQRERQGLPVQWATVLPFTWDEAEEVTASMATRHVTRILVAVAVLLAVAVAVAVTIVLMDPQRSNDAAAPPATVTVSVTQSPPSQTERPDPPAVEEPVTEEAPPVVEGSECSDSEVRTFQTDASGRSLVCGYSGRPTPHWLQHGDDDGSVHNVGDPCDSSVDRVSRDPSGLFIMCGGSTWVTHP